MLVCLKLLALHRFSQVFPKADFLFYGQYATRAMDIISTMVHQGSMTACVCSCVLLFVTSASFASVNLFSGAHLLACELLIDIAVSPLVVTTQTKRNAPKTLLDRVVASPGAATERRCNDRLSFGEYASV